MTNNNIPSSVPVVQEDQQQQASNNAKTKQHKRHNNNNNNRKKQQQPQPQNQQPQPEQQNNLPKSPPRKQRKKDDKQQQQGGGDPFGLVFDPVPGQTNSPNTEEPPQQDPVHHGPVDNSDDSDISPITPIHVPMKRMPSAHLLQEAAKKKTPIDDSVFDVNDSDKDTDDDSDNDDGETVKKPPTKVMDWNLSKSTPTPPTPISPQRMPFQSISTASLLIQTLEESLSTDAKTRILIWREWGIMMKECDTLDPNSIHRYLDDNYQQLNFKEVFVRSKLLERVVEGVILEPDMPSVSELWELFGHCLIGDENVHYQLIHYMQKIGEMLKGKKLAYKEYFIKLIVNIVSEMKIKPDQQKVLMSALHQLDKKILDTLELISKSNKKDSKKALASKVVLSETLVHHCEEKRKLMLTYYKRNGSLSLSSPSTVVDIDGMFQELSSTQNLSVQLKKLQEERKTTESSLQNKISEAKKGLSTTSNKEKKLLERKKQLEEELNQVNQDLQSLASEKTKYQQQKKDSEVQMRELDETFMHRTEELKNVAEIQKEEKNYLSQLKQYVTQTKTILINTLGHRSNAVELQLHQCTMQYIDKMGVFLEYMNARMLELLTQKISPLCEKLNSLGRKREQNNSAAQMQLIDDSIRKYHRKYSKAVAVAEDILQKAEEIHQTTKSQFEEKYAFSIQKQVYTHLEMLSKSQSMMLQFNDRLAWVAKEVNMLPRSHSKNDINYDTDASEISDAPMLPDDAHMEDSHLRNSNSSVSSAEVVMQAAIVKQKQTQQPTPKKPASVIAEQPPQQQYKEQQSQQQRPKKKKKKV